MSKVTYHTKAGQRFCRAVSIEGDGRFATVSDCGGLLTVMLHATMTAATVKKHQIDDTGCGTHCTPEGHSIVDLDLDAPVSSPYPTSDLAECAEREVKWRRRVYPTRIANGRMTQALADKQIAMMEAIAAWLRERAELERLL